MYTHLSYKVYRNPMQPVFVMFTPLIGTHKLPRLKIVNTSEYLIRYVPTANDVKVVSDPLA